MVERLIKSNGIELCAETFGADGDPPLMLIMGLGAQMISWDDEFCKMLAARKFRVVRFDNRDVGRSSKLVTVGVPNVLAMMGELALGRMPRAPYLLTDMAADVIGLMDALGIAKAHIVGASMGGMIGQTMAIHSAPRVRSLTSIMSTTGDPRLPAAAPEAAAALMTPAPLDRDGYPKHHAKVLKVLRGAVYAEDGVEDVARGLRNFERGIDPAGAARQLAAVFGSGDRTAALRTVTVPTLVIHGDADPLVRVEAGRATAAAIPGATLKIMLGMGHTLPKALWPQLIDAIAAHASAH